MRVLHRTQPTGTPPVSQSQNSYLSAISGLFWRQYNTGAAQGVRNVTSSSPEVASQPPSLPIPVDSNPSDKECTICRSTDGEDNDTEIALKTPTEACTHPPQVCIGCLQQVMGYYDIQKWAVKEVFDRYDKLLMQDTLRVDGSYVFCVKPSCTAGQEHTGGENNNIVTCYHCGTKQCFRHQIAWHEGLTCDQWDEQQRVITNQQEQKTGQWIQVETKACPGQGCGRRIQKIDGCDHLKCKRPGGCGHEFCWQCLAPWLPIISGDNSRHYDNCRYYSGRPGQHPAPPEIVAARTVVAPLPPSLPPLMEAATPVLSPMQPRAELNIPHVTQQRESPRRVRSAWRATEISMHSPIPTTTTSASPASSAEPSRSSSSARLPTNKANSISPSEFRTVSQIRTAAARMTSKSVKGAAPLTAMNSLRRLAEEAHSSEQQGDLRAALFQFVQVGVLLQFVQESHEYKHEAQKGRHGALYQLMQEFNRGPFESMMKSVHNIQQTLLKIEQTEAERPSESSHFVANTPSTSNHRIGGTLADRLKRLQGAGIQADYGRPTQIPLMGNRGMPRSRGPIPGPSSSQRPPTSPPDGVQTISPTVDLPITTTITPQRLNSLLETRGLNILLLDVRNRNEFERERINHDAIVCLEPVSLTRPGMNSSMIGVAQLLSPSTEQVLFKNRSRFDLIIMYDEDSENLGHPLSPMSALSSSIFEKEFHRPLKRPPMVLVGGLKAWKAVIGDDGVLKRLSPTQSGVPSPIDGSTPGSSSSEEEDILYTVPRRLKNLRSEDAVIASEPSGARTIDSPGHDYVQCGARRAAYFWNE